MNKNAQFLSRYRFAIVLVIGAFSIMAAAALYVNSRPEVPTQAADNALADTPTALTQQLLRGNQLKSNGTSVQNTSPDVDLKTVVSKRKAAMEKALKEGRKKEFFLNLLKPEEISQLPQSIRDSSDIEKPLKAKGKLKIIHFDNVGKKSAHEKSYIISDDNPSTKQEVVFPDNTKVSTDSQVELSGVAFGTTLAATDTAVTSLSAPPGSIPGVHNTLVILLNFSDNTSQPASPDFMKQMLFSGSKGLNDYYTRTSNNKISFAGDVIGWLTLSSSNYDDCDIWFENWQAEADTKATALIGAAKMATYAHRLYVYNTPLFCSYEGISTLGGAPSRSDVFLFNTEPYTHTYLHEMGHALGVHHANGYYCETPNSCISQEYGDVLDIMGNIRYRLDDTYARYMMNAPHLEALGWLPATSIKDLTGTTGGTFTITPLETFSGTQTVKFKIPNSDFYYYLEYRQQLGLDYILDPLTTRGIRILSWNGDPVMQTHIWDGTPATYWDFIDGTLSDAQTWTNQQVTIKQISHSAAGATVEVSLPDFTSLSPIEPWQTTSSLPEPVDYQELIAAKHSLFNIGGYNNSVELATVYKTVINDNGSLGAWTPTTPLPATVSMSLGLTDGNYIFMFGGARSGSATSSVYSAPINADSTLGTWTSLPALPTPLRVHSGAISNGYVYIVGGLTGTGAYNQTTYFAKLNSDGTIGAWSTTTQTPVALFHHQVVANNGYLYVTYNYELYYAKVNATNGSLGPWTLSPVALPIYYQRHSASVVNGSLVMTGGADPIGGGIPTTRVYATKFNSDGSVGAWSEAPQLPKAIQNHAGFFYNGYLYAAGGQALDQKAWNGVYYAKAKAVVPTVVPTAVPTKVVATVAPTIAIASITPTKKPTNTPIPTPTPLKGVVIIPIADTYVDLASPTANFGTSSYLRCDGDKDELTTYMKFDLKSLAGKTIKSAKLRLYVTDASTQTASIKDSSNTSWSESTMTYSNKPSVSSTVYGTIPATTINTLIHIDVTAKIKLKLGSLVTLTITKSGTDGLKFKTRETDDIPLRPALVIEY